MVIQETKVVEVVKERKFMGGDMIAGALGNLGKNLKATEDLEKAAAAASGAAALASGAASAAAKAAMTVGMKLKMGGGAR